MLTKNSLDISESSSIIIMHIYIDQNCKNFYNNELLRENIYRDLNNLFLITSL